MNLSPTGPSRSGFSLLEVIAVVVVASIVVALIMPSLRGQIYLYRSHAALNQLAADLAYARMYAIQAGNRVEVRFVPSTANTCITSYQLVEMSTPELIVKTVPVAEELRPLCLTMNAAGPVRINSRGLLPSAFRTWTVDRSVAQDELVLGQGGRLRKTY